LSSTGNAAADFIFYVPEALSSQKKIRRRYIRIKVRNLHRVIIESGKLTNDDFTCREKIEKQIFFVCTYSMEVETNCTLAINFVLFL